MINESEKRDRILVVGVGSIGERHVRCFQATGRTHVSICEPNARLREEVGNRYEVNHRFANLGEALGEQYSAAVVAVPADLHITLARKAIDAGLHVLIEKPLSVTLEGVADLCDAAARSDRVAAVAYVYRAHPALAAMHRAIRDGAFGKPVQVVVVAGQNFPKYRPTYRETYYVDHARGGGAIQDAMTHLVNAAEWLVGPVERVVADAEHKLIPDVEVEDVVHFLARHGKVIASYSLNQFQSPNEATITVVCERGTARFEYHKHRWRHMLRPDEPWQEEQVLGLERDTLFLRQAEAFLDAIDGRAAPLCTLADGQQTLLVNLALRRSLETRTWQEVAQPAPSTCN